MVYNMLGGIVDYSSFNIVVQYHVFVILKSYFMFLKIFNTHVSNTIMFTTF